MIQYFNRKQKGFTLIELLVVIAIIGILATIVLVSLSGAREKARNAQRQSDIRQISLAMEMYYDDGQKYPTGAGPAMITSIGTYLPSVPEDPLNSGDYKYVWIDNTGVNKDQEYCAYATLENGGVFTASKNGTLSTTTAPGDLNCGW